LYQLLNADFWPLDDQTKLAVWQHFWQQFVIFAAGTTPRRSLSIAARPAEDYFAIKLPLKGPNLIRRFEAHRQSPSPSRLRWVLFSGRRRAKHGEVASGWIMPKAPFVFAAMVGIGLAGGTEFAGTDIPPDRKMLGDLGRSLAAGVILGSTVWPHGLSPPDLQSTLLFNPPAATATVNAGCMGSRLLLWSISALKW
jgi:hypothetical protein